MACWSEEGEKKEEVDAVAEEDRAMVEDREAASASFFPEAVTAGEGEGSILEVLATSGAFFMKTVGPTSKAADQT